MFKRILVPLDGSDLAERALGPALAIARQAGGEVHLLRVPVMEAALVPASAGLGGYDLYWPGQAIDASRAEAHEYLDALAKDRAEAGFTLIPHIVEGDVAGTILDFAWEQGVDLIVMSTHGYSGITRWEMGCITEKVLRSAANPVLVGQSDEPVRQVLITLDGSKLAERALAPGLAVASALGAPVTLLRVVKEVEPAELSELEEKEAGFGRRLEQELAQEARDYLDGLAQIAAQEGLEVCTAAPVGRAADRILEYAQLNDIGLTVMATHGATGLRRWVYGSITEKVLRGTHGSMLIVRPETGALKS